MFTHLKQKMDDYDPYGLMRVNATQSLMVALGFIFLNAIYNFKAFSLILLLLVYGLIGTGTLFGYYPRLKAIAIFWIGGIIYSFVLCIVQNYLTLTLIAVGISIYTMFYLSRSIPQLFPMIALIQIVASMACEMPHTAVLHELFLLLAKLSVMSLLLLSFLALFPKIYFFRIWLRSLYLTVEEIKQKFDQFQTNTLAIDKTLSKHLVVMYDFTHGLSDKENGFSARRIALRLTQIYTSLATLVTHSGTIEPYEINYIKNICDQICNSLKNYQPIFSVQKIPSENIIFLRIQEDFLYIISIWNKLCLKI